MLKPFEIKQTRPEEGGTGVIYSVSKREVAADRETVKTIETYLLVPDGNNIDVYVFEHLRRSGWIQ